MFLAPIRFYLFIGAAAVWYVSPAGRLNVEPTAGGHMHPKRIPSPRHGRSGVADQHHHLRCTPWRRHRCIQHFTIQYPHCTLHRRFRCTSLSSALNPSLPPPLTTSPPLATHPLPTHPPPFVVLPAFPGVTIGIAQPTQGATFAHVHTIEVVIHLQVQYIAVYSIHSLH
jgi:hypothetical protein